MCSFYFWSNGHRKSDWGKTKTPFEFKIQLNLLKNKASFIIYDLQLELDKAKLVLLVMPNSTIVGAALHVHQLASRRRVHLDTRFWDFRHFMFNNIIRNYQNKNANAESVEKAEINNLYRHQWSVVAYVEVMTFWFPLVPMALIERFVDLKLQKKI